MIESTCDQAGAVPPTLPAVVDLRSNRDTARVLLVSDDDRLTFGQLDRRSAHLAGRLLAAGIGPGDRVGLIASNGIEWVIHAVAAMRVGAVLVPLSTLLRPPELIDHLAAASVAHLIAEPEFRGRCYLDELDSAIPGTVRVSAQRRVATLPSLRSVWSLGGFPSPSVDSEVVESLGERVSASDDLVILFTSGSSGTPKGVIHTHGGAIGAVEAGLNARCIGPGDIVYIPMPFFWTGGFSGGLMSTLVAGATLILDPEPEPAKTLSLLERECVTLFRGWPDQAAKVAAHPDFAVTDLADLGDGSLPAVLPEHRRPPAGARSNLFGMTETFGPYSADRLDQDMPADKHGSCGRPFEWIDVRVVDPESGERLPAESIGELIVRGPNLFRGLVGRTRDEVFTPDGWFLTGDLGQLDEDGYLWYHGRVDDMVKVKGTTVYPTEVERALRSIGAVSEAHVADVTADDGRAVIGAMVLTTLSIEDLRLALRHRLSAFKVPTRWMIVDDESQIPRLASGKADKLALRVLLSRSP